MIKNESNAFKTAVLDEAAQSAVSLLLQEKHCPVAESIQMILCFIAEHEDGYMCQASVSHMSQILQGVLDATEPELAVL